MKNNSKFLILLSAWGLLAAGCAKEGKTTDPVEGEKTFVRLTVRTDVRTSRAATENGEAATGAEIAVDPSVALKVVVFNADGSLDNSGLMELRAGATEGQYETVSALNVTSGEKYFFVFANDRGGLITGPNGINMAMFMQTSFSVNTPGETVSNIANVAGIPEVPESPTTFLLGSLWAEKIPVQGGGTAENPQQVTLQIGRLAAKVNLINIVYIMPDNLEGFLGPPTDGVGIYRLGTMPTSIYNVGNHDLTKTPPLNTNTGVLVTSAAHDLPAGTGYLDYSTWAAMDTPKFTTENTSVLSDQGEQFYGNTTYIQIRSKYTPAPDELYNPLDFTIATLDPSGTFWAATVVENPTSSAAEIHAGRTILFATDPNNANDIDMTKPVNEYINGITYHKFPIADPNETDAVMINRVLRNHYYEFAVTRFNSIGSPDEAVDPTEPLKSNTMVQFTVKVRNWDKVSNENVVVD